MPIMPLAICLEDLDAPHDDERYLRCVAVPGGEPGLGLDDAGVVHWMPDGPSSYELWVSADGRLALERGRDTGEITVRRGGRSVQAPEGKPVILLDQDRLDVAGRRLLVHVHGETDEVHEPSWLSSSALARMARAAAAVVAVGTAVGVGAPAQGAPMGTAPEPIQVRRKPPKPMPMYTYCEILGLKKDKAKGQLLSLECKYGRIRVGATGQVLDNKGMPVKDGAVKILSVKGRKITASTKLKKLGAAKRARFYR